MTALWGYITFIDLLTCSLLFPDTYWHVCTQAHTLTVTCLPHIHTHTHSHMFIYNTHTLGNSWKIEAPLDLSQDLAKINQQAGGQNHLLDTWKTTVFLIIHLSKLRLRELKGLQAWKQHFLGRSSCREYLEGRCVYRFPLHGGDARCGREVRGCMFTPAWPCSWCCCY